MRLYTLCAIALLFVAACGSGDDNGEETCGPGGTCPSGFTCNPVTNRCIRGGGGTPDARPPDATMMQATAPNTTIDTGPTGLGNVAAVSFTFSADKTPATFECRVDMAMFATCTSPQMLTVSDGAHTFEVRAIAGGLTDQSPASRMFTVDTMPPDTTITTGPTGTVTATDAKFEFTSTEPTGATFRCKLDAETSFTACTSGKTYTALPLGAHTFSVVAVDAAGNVDASAATRMFTIVASSGLDTTIMSGPPALTTSTDAAFTYFASRGGAMVAGANFDCKLDTGAFEACNGGSKTYSGLADGAHSFQVRAVVGTEVDDTPATYNWTVSKNGLLTVINSGPANNSTVGGSVTFTYSSIPIVAGVMFKCGLDDAIDTCDPSTATFTNLANGSTHKFSVQAVLGSVMGNIETRMFTVDTMGPTVDISSPTDMQVLHGPVVVVFSLSETATTVCNLNTGPALGQCTSGMSLNLPNGDYTLVITATDPVGNVGMDTVKFSVLLNKPTVSIIEPQPDAFTGPDGAVTFSSSPNAVRAECTLDGKPQDCGVLGFSFSGLSAGSHTASVTVFDALTGGVASDPATVTWKVDAAPPLVTDLGIQDLGLGQALLSFFLTDESGVAQVSCRLDGGDFFQCGTTDTGTFVLTELAPGDHVVEVCGVDLNGVTGCTGQSQPPPATLAFINFTHVTGPGHLALIGHDFQTPPSGAKPGLSQDEIDMQQVLINAVSLAPAISEDFVRPLNMLMIVPTDADPNNPDPQREQANILGILGNMPGQLFNVTKVHVDEVTPEALQGIDLAFIVDFNDRDGVSDYSAALDLTFRDFLEVGGDIVLTSGLNFMNEPSDTYQILDRDLFGLDNVHPFEGAVTVPCNDEDSLTFDIKGSFNVPNFGTVAFETLEPWVSWARDTVENDDLFVLHKWFGQTNLGPVGFSAFGYASLGGTATETVYFQNASFTLRGQCGLLSNGTAVHHMDPGGHVSWAEGFNSDGFLFRYMFTVMGTQPLDFLDTSYLTPNDEFDPNTIRVILPPHPSGNATSYSVNIGSTQNGSSDPNDIEIYAPPSTGTELDGTYNLLAEAYDANDVLLGYIVQTGFTQTVGTINLTTSTWAAPTITPSIVLGGLTGVDSVTLNGALNRGRLSYDEHGGGESRDPNDLSFPSWFYSPSGGGTRPFTHFDHSEGVRFLRRPVFDFDSSSRRWVHGSLISSLAVNLAQALLPRLGYPVVSFNGNRLVLTWGAAGSLAAADGGKAIIDWRNSRTSANSWEIVFPSGTSVTAPPPPPSDPNNPFWPSPAGFDADDPNDPNDPFTYEPSDVRLTDQSFLSGYDALRNALWVFFDDERILKPEMGLQSGTYEQRLTIRRDERKRTIGNVQGKGPAGAKAP